MNMKNNNVRIIILIIAMFMVSLSIIGFTYAYFTAQITGNPTNDNVKVTSGNLEVTFTSSSTITASGIVPGWKSDGRSWYDPMARDSAGHIIAQHIDGSTTAVPTNYKTKEYGYALPSKFTVKSTGDSTNNAYYAVELTSITNQITKISTDNTWDDTKNMMVYLYKGTYDGTTDLSSDKVIWSSALNSSNSQIIPKVFEIAPTHTNNLYVVLEYKNDTTHDQSQNMGKAVSATVKIVGVAKNTAGNWVNESGTTMVSSSVSGNPVVLGNNNS